jgi:NTP pyrophosphatase (non-canonical NTP hydrolase)
VSSLVTVEQAERLRRLVPLALARWGVEPQLRQLAEECSELSAQVNRHARGRDPGSRDLAMEGGQVAVMLVQLAAILPDGMFDAAVGEAVDKLEAKLASRAKRRVATCPTSDSLADMLVACTGPDVDRAAVARMTRGSTLVFEHGEVERTDAGVWILWGYDAKDGEP